MTCARGEGQNLRTVFPWHPAQSASLSRGIHVTATRQLQSGPPLTSRGAPSRSRNGKSDGLQPTANIPSGIGRSLGVADTAPPIPTARLPAARVRSAQRSQNAQPAQSQASARPTHVDGRVGIADRRSPRRENHGVDPGVPALPNLRGAPLAMAATCRPVLRRPIKPPLVPNSAPCHPSAGAILSLSIHSDSRCPRSHFPRQAARLRPGTLPNLERSHFEEGGGARALLRSETS